MISVSGDKDDYAIMKQVQQIKLAYPQMTIETLDGRATFAQLGPTEKLFLVSHGNAASGDLSNIDRYELKDWLKDKNRGVPPNFGGIVICSCYSGLGGEDSLAHYIAKQLAGKTAAGTTVAGANGYSFGTPEFARTGFSSVLRRELSSFYLFTQNSMADEWLGAKPTHTGGALATHWNIPVNIEQTIQQNLEAKQAFNQDVVKARMAELAKEGKEVENELKQTITQIAGNSVADRASNIIAGNTEAVNKWNAAIDRQYQLFHDYYLWASTEKAFTVAAVP